MAIKSLKKTVNLDKAAIHLDFFLKKFDEKQKMAVFCRLYWLAKSDGKLTKNESLFLSKIAERFSEVKSNKKENQLNKATFDQLSDRKLDKKETIFLTKIAEILDLSSEQLNNFICSDEKNNSLVLAGLNLQQKEWLIITLFGVIYSDGNVLKAEYDAMKKLISDINFSSSNEEPLQQVEKLIKNKYDTLKVLHAFATGQARV